MSTCKDCIHFELCQHNEYKEAQYFGKDKEIYITIKNNMTCIYFKPKSDYERKRGEWKINSDGYYPYCSRCGKEPKNGVMTDFCPNCGADMRKEDNNV